MALDAFSRLEMLIGHNAVETLHHKHVAVFGVGGVGGYAVEALARSGIGSLDLIDNDQVALTNLNRQIIATRKTVGKYKADVMEDLSVLQLCTRNDASDFPEAYSSAIPVRSRLRTS